MARPEHKPSYDFTANSFNCQVYISSNSQKKSTQTGKEIVNSASYKDDNSTENYAEKWEPLYDGKVGKASLRK